MTSSLRSNEAKPSADTQFKVFYSWQSDLSKKTNSNLIRGAITEAAVHLTNDDALTIKVSIDEATRDVPGSPNIAATILKKIREANCFACDISVVGRGSDSNGGERKYCNPNVAIELGYAISELGWDRIVLIFNEAYGKLPDDLPFDVQGHRTMKFRCRPEIVGTNDGASEISNAKSSLKQSIVAALRKLITDKPLRPVELNGQAIEQIQLNRDQKTLSEVLNRVPSTVIDQFLDALGYGRITMIGDDFYQSFEHLVTRSSFHLYDEKLALRMKALFKAWNACFRYVDRMDLSKTGSYLFFRLDNDTFKSSQQKKEYKHVVESAGPLYAAWKSLLDYVLAEKAYVGIDLKAIGTEAIKAYLAKKKD